MIKKAQAESDEWVELWPAGVIQGPLYTRPILLMKGKNEYDMLPVWLSVAELEGFDPQEPIGLRSVFFGQGPIKILKELNWEIKQCRFVELLSHRQIVDLTLRSNDVDKNIRLNAEEAITLCLATQCQFYATRDYMERCRFLNSELLQVTPTTPWHEYMM